MSDQTLISYAQNGEDVVLWRALRHVTNGRYVDVGACDPVELSLTKALYDRGWRGIDIDAVPAYAARLSAARVGNEVVQAAITDRPVTHVTFHELVGTGLSTLLAETAEAHEVAGFERQDIDVPAMTLDAVCERSALLGGDLHLLKIDVEGAEEEVLRSFDLERWRPWVVVVEATRPLTSEPSFEAWDPILVEAGYTFRLFDGVSRFYSSPAHPELAAALSYPACVLDDYVPVRQHLQDLRVDELTAQLEEASADMGRWRNQAVAYWADAVASVQRGEDQVRKARHDAEQATTKLDGVREQLRKTRSERDRLRLRVKRMGVRLEALESAQPPQLVRAAARVRSAVRRAAKQ